MVLFMPPQNDASRVKERLLRGKRNDCRVMDLILLKPEEVTN